MGCRAPWRYRVPSAGVPRPAPRQPGHGHPTATQQPVLAEGIDGVLTAGGCEPARRRPKRRDHVAVHLYQPNRDPGRGAHRSPAIRARARRTPAVISCSKRRYAAFLLLGKARITNASAGPRSASAARLACRSRRATRCRSTALPTALLTTNPTRGPSEMSVSCRAWITRSGWGTRMPCLTVAPNSAERVIRYRAGSTLTTADQADSERRPLRRRPDTMARPARVRMRNRKP
jgi:hypothetical protein